MCMHAHLHILTSKLCQVPCASELNFKEICNKVEFNGVVHVEISMQGVEMRCTEVVVFNSGLYF